ncbi:uncharacterized protein [Prorops nasuta]|uniref:uncharacterized protein n=1 Tax=Prorops nasuta TaxID=863751 RepID=UPI0034CF653E
MLRKKLQRQKSTSNIDDDDDDDDDEANLLDYSSEMEWEPEIWEQEISPENIIRFDEDNDDNPDFDALIEVLVGIISEMEEQIEEEDEDLLRNPEDIPEFSALVEELVEIMGEMEEAVQEEEDLIVIVEKLVEPRNRIQEGLEQAEQEQEEEDEEEENEEQH